MVRMKDERLVKRSETEETRRLDWTHGENER